jgi:hypothetical protein
MKHALALVLAACAALAGTAHAVDVYKWKDSKGVVHYGDRPASGVAAKTLNVPDDALTPEDEEAANERLQRARDKLAEPTDDDDEPVVVAPRRRKPVASSSCEESWQRFDFAQAFYASHRAANGKGVSPAGLALCRPMPQPSCTR